jgi:SynChlorMet cassette protein ScmC
MCLKTGTVTNGKTLLISHRNPVSPESTSHHIPPANIDTSTHSEWQALDLETLVIWKHKTRPEFICSLGDNLDYREELYALWNSLLPIHHQAVHSGGIPLHGALVERNGKGIILAAPGGTGKSTSCRRLPEGFRTLGDDVALAVKTEHGAYHAHPLPTWSDHILRRSDRTWDVQEHLQLNAVFFIMRAFSNRIEPLGQGYATALINQSSMQICHVFTERIQTKAGDEFKRILFGNASHLAVTVPAWMIYISQTGPFWLEIDKALKRLGA